MPPLSRCMSNSQGAISSKGDAFVHDTHNQFICTHTKYVYTCVESRPSKLFELAHNEEPAKFRNKSVRRGS